MGIWAKELWEPEGLRTPGKHGPLNQLGKAREGSEKLKQRWWSLPGSVPYPLHMCYGCWLTVLGRLLSVKGGGCLLPFYPFLRPFSYYWIASPSLDMRVCAWSYCILLGPWEACFFLGDKGKWEKSGGGGTWKMEGGEAVVWMNYMKEEKN